MNYAERLFLLLAAHALADFPLQGEFLALGKNRNTESGRVWWRICLPAHSLIHGLFVYLVTNSLVLAGAESVIHGITDYAKCENALTIEQDQLVHVLCKMLWALKKRSID